MHFFSFFLFLLNLELIERLTFAPDRHPKNNEFRLKIRTHYATRWTMKLFTGTNPFMESVGLLVPL